MSTSKKEANEKKYATEFVQSSSLKTESEERQLQFLDALEYSTVALRLAVAFINATNNGNEHFGIDDYLKVWNEKKGDLSNVSIDGDKKAKAIMLALRISSDALGEKPNGQEAIELCKLIAYLAPDKPVPVSFLKKSTTKDLEEPLKLLELYAIIKLKPEDKSVRIDFPIQKALKLSFKNVEVATLERGLELVVKDELNSGNVYHAMSLWDHATTHAVLVKEHCEFIGKLMNAVNQCIGNPDLLIKYGKKQIEALEKHLGRHNEIVCKLKSNISITIEQRGFKTPIDLLECYKLSRGSAPDGKRWPHSLAPNALKSRFNDAINIAKRGENRRALEILRQVLRDAEKNIEVGLNFILLTKGYIAVAEYELKLKPVEERIRAMVAAYDAIDDSNDSESAIVGYKMHVVKLLLNEGRMDVVSRWMNDLQSKS